MYVYLYVHTHILYTCDVRICHTLIGVESQHVCTGIIYLRLCQHLQVSTQPQVYSVSELTKSCLHMTVL